MGDRGGREFSRGGSRGGPGMMGRGGRGGRGRGGPMGNPLDREVEKQEGKKSAIAETIAMMNKMKMEDKERKDAHQRFEEERRERNRELGIPDPIEPPQPIVPEMEHFEDYHGRGGRRGRGSRGDRPPRGGRGMGRGRGGPNNANMGLIPSMFGGQANPAMHSAPGMFFPPPGMPGFPGMEQLLLSGVPGFPPGNYPGSQPFFPHLAGGPPPQFGNQFGFNPRGHGGMGRGRGGGRGGYQRSSEHQKPITMVEDHNEADTSTNVTEVENPDLVEGSKGDIIATSQSEAIEDTLTAAVVASVDSESSIPHNGENDGSTSNEDQSNNAVINSAAAVSGQV